MYYFVEQEDSAVVSMEVNTKKRAKKVGAGDLMTPRKQLRKPKSERFQVTTRMPASFPELPAYLVNGNFEYILQYIY